MRLLIITQKVDATDANLGFFVRWIERLAERAEITVIANEIHRDAVGYLPQNVHIDSLGKGRGVSRMARFLRYQKLLWRYLPQVDGVFFHMCPEYVLGAHLFPWIFRAKTLLWYVHKEVNWRLRFAAVLVDKIFTASKESCRLHSKKVEVVGHGIDVSSHAFDFQKNQTRGIATATNAHPTSHGRSPGGRVAHANDVDSAARREKGGGEIRLLTVGRIAPAKDLQTLILGFLELRKRFPEATFSIVGEPITGANRLYREELRGLSTDIRFLGGVSHEGLPRLFREATVFVHASRTGSMDKAVLEALAAGLPVFSSSEAFTADMGVRKFRHGDVADFAEKISRAFSQGELVINTAGSAYVRERHSLNRLVRRVLSFYATHERI